MALLFLAIVIPVAVQGLQVASRAGEMAARRAVAARIAERVMNELLITGDYLGSTGSGTIQEGQQTYDWEMRLDPWIEGNLRQMVVRVKFPVQGREQEVRLSTLVDTQTR